jgi:hypothetical protein
MTNSDDKQEQIKEILRKLAAHMNENSVSYSLNYSKGYSLIVSKISNLLEVLEYAMWKLKEIPTKQIYDSLVMILALSEDVCTDEEIEQAEKDKKKDKWEKISEQFEEYLLDE